MLNKTKGYLMIATAGCLWGSVGFFVKKLLEFELPLSTIIFWRMSFAFFILFILLFFTNRSRLILKRTLIKNVMAIGLISQCFFNISYFSAIQLTSIATAVTLLYTAPIFIAVMARIFFREFFTKNKILALLLCVAGCFFTITGGFWENLQFNSKGILFGLASGITFGSLTILSKPIANKCHSYTIVLYSIGFGLLFYLPFAQPMMLFQSDFTPLIWFYLLSLSVISTIFAYLFYMGGLSMGVEASKAGIISTVEVVMSVIVSYLLFQEELWGWKLIGIIMVIGSVIVVQLDNIVGKNRRFKIFSRSSQIQT